MCGFLCVVTRTRVAETIDVTALNRDVLRHRGPDSSGELLCDHAYVRHWRLSIVDLSDTSSQPYGAGGSWLIYNGEIYNYEDLAGRLSLKVPGDTALLYELCKRGIDGEELERARGFYSYLWLTENGLKLSGARDPFGKKPLFYHVDDEEGVAVFASEEKAIVDCMKRSRIDFAAISQYVLYKQVFHGATYFENIRQLAPGARFHFDARRWTLTVDREWADYYEMPAAEVFSLGAPAGAGESATQVRERLCESLALRVPRDVTASVALSGGVDSALIADLAVEASLMGAISRFLTVGFEDPASDESVRASEIAAALSVTDLHSIVRFSQRELTVLLQQCIEQASSPLEHPHYLSYFVLCHHASKLSKVLITGEGADELFMGYDHYRAPGASFAFREYLSREDEDGFTGAAGERPFDGIRRAARIATFRARALSSRMLSREYEIKSHLLTLLSRNDKMGMASSVEVRAPFLDKEIVALSMSWSDADLVVDGSTKHVLKGIFAARFPGIRAQDRKIGFRVPFDEMFLADRSQPDVRERCELATRALREECGLRLTSLESITPRLGWSLLNIGMFLDAQGYGS
jgi:asparagine synthase (glutamine-hydrolysing)